MLLELDMTELVTDPDFQVSITRLRPTVSSIVGSEGRTATTYAPTTLSAIVQPTKDPDIMNPAPEGERMDSWILICSHDSLLIAGAETVSDIVEWNGSTYRVMKVDDCSNYGYFAAYAQEYHGGTPTLPDPPAEGDA